MDICGKLNKCYSLRGLSNNKKNNLPGKLMNHDVLANMSPHEKQQPTQVLTTILRFHANKHHRIMKIMRQKPPSSLFW